jgi:hypothetical protein
VRDEAQVRGVARIAAALPSEPGTAPRQETFGRFANLPLGHRFSADVLGHIGGDSYLVSVAGENFRMSLPGRPRPGDQLQLSLLAKAPRLTFLLLPAQQGNTASLSSTGRLLGKILVAADDLAAHMGLVGSEPLVPTPAADPARIGIALHDRIAMSGLFHEAHLAEWANGTRSLESLSREPQQQLHQLVPSGSDAPVESEAVNPDLVRLINLQLDVLEHGRIIWRGEAWPGQAMKWDICKDTPEEPARQRDNGGETPQSIWRTTVQIELPTLGRVSATLRVDQECLQIRIDTVDPSATLRLKAQSTELIRNLDAAGLMTDSLEVECHVDAVR